MLTSTEITIMNCLESWQVALALESLLFSIQYSSAQPPAQDGMGKHSRSLETFRKIICFTVVKKHCTSNIDTCVDLTCFSCSSTEGIDNPVCLHPISRHAETMQLEGKGTAF